MARGGVNKATVQTARLALIARGEHPSIDAVRVEMGNTGSKTTIHRYLRELDETDLRRGAPQETIGDELTELVARLAQRLQEQAQERIDQAQTAFDTQQRTLQEELNSTRKELNDASQRCADQTQIIDQHTAALLDTRQQLQSQQTENARLQQASQDMATRLEDKDGQIRSLEEKHLHARDALEHYRNSVKEQRDQEQRRHEGQVQQVQMELRQAQQSALVRQEEITQLNRANERLLTESRSTSRELDTHKDQLARLTIQANSAVEQLQQAQTQRALLEERLHNSHEEVGELKQRLTDQEQQSRVLELILIKTELALDNLRKDLASPEEEAPPPAQA
ncbi:integrase [Pseudomonas syringae]|uniref:Integrase n=1 Tax=Pseudomonas syringae TaxID=317 RepID=A0A1C7YWT8_PSESX|nr:DNA-binding protein [Pseudomonas syringae]OCR22214.1 integrase [Pseudomonas syringae]